MTMTAMSAQERTVIGAGAGGCLARRGMGWFQARTAVLPASVRMEPLASAERDYLEVLAELEAR